MKRRSYDFVWGVGLGAIAAGAVVWAAGRQPATEPTALPTSAVEARASAAPSASATAAPSSAGAELCGGPTALHAGEDADWARLASRAREAMAQRAWVRPKGENVRALLAEAEKRWPEDERLTALRREAAERLVADAVALKYAAQSDAAAKGVRLALEWAPDLPGAQPFLHELEAPPDKPPPTDGLEAAPLPTRTPGVPLPGDSRGSPRYGF